MGAGDLHRIPTSGSLSGERPVQAAVLGVARLTIVPVAVRVLSEQYVRKR
jgi:hypothetical protein